jgi:hypothetical protein
MDLFFRKIVRDKGQALGKLAAEIQEFAKDDAGNDALAKERALLAQALEDVQGIVNHMVNDLMGSVEQTRNIYKVGLNTTRALMGLGDLVVGWLLLRQAAVALDKLGTAAGKDRAFYEGKVASARWFAASVFPELTAKRAIAEATDLSLMDLDEAAF